uniref:UDENN domain-containing protein n=1 Tax=Macrostomum lignano TaxID=282301 RepID=A0A1I8GIL1_9PLAT
LELTALADATPAPQPPHQQHPIPASTGAGTSAPPSPPPQHWTSALAWQLRLADCLLRLIGEAGLERCVALTVCHAELLCRLLALASLPAPAAAPAPPAVTDAAFAAVGLLYSISGHQGLMALHSPAWLQPALTATLGSAINCLVKRLSDAKSAAAASVAIGNDSRLLLACLHAVSNSGLSLGSLLAVCRLPRSLPGQSERKSVAARLLVSECLLHLHRLPEQRQRRILCRDMRSELAGILGASLTAGGGGGGQSTRRSTSFVAAAPSTPTPDPAGASASPVPSAASDLDAEENAAALLNTLGAYFNSLA